MIAYNACSSSPDFVSYCNDRLKSFLPIFLDIATAEIKSYDISDDDIAYYSNAIQYNLQGGKLIRGWCVELLQTAFLVADDIMDKSIMRRSNVCWYMVPTVGISNAVNDTMFLNTLVHRIIANQLKDSKYLVTVMNLFTEVSMITILGQHMDTYDAMDASLFDTPTGATSLYYRICKNKTSYYTFFLPIKLGMIVSGIDQGNINYSKLESVSSLLGHLFQAAVARRVPIYKQRSVRGSLRQGNVKGLPNRSHSQINDIRSKDFGAFADGSCVPRAFESFCRMKPLGMAYMQMSDVEYTSSCTYRAVFILFYGRFRFVYEACKGLLGETLRQPCLL
ncbi:farnesyl pyrophosphate synthetase [Babesia ovata]|uniref:Farnesyl pyrophosphate synthetase n=1 Tax=Babesia ovata TaxID=189622 RepID=A0A2H6KI87_9APIC|nr:farnesyl pyrophosphate synthetase [Babesia ovata]GBE62703.1 farnesyl pyrophosphate synthetase [Babesia ovata]